METSFAPPAGITLAVAVVGALFAAILPTCLYLYVEPRGRPQWAVAGDTPSSRRAPVLVRFTAWLSFAVGQLAFPWLAVPVVCGVLLYLQTKLGVGGPVGAATTGAIGVAALVQSITAMRLLPLGVRLLARDAKLQSRAASRAKFQLLLGVGVLGGGFGLNWAMAAVPGFVHPWLRMALTWSAVYPVMAFAALSLVHSLLLGRCAGLLADTKGELSASSRSSSSR
jgi:hypothetical protein